MLDDPRVNFAISTRGRQPGLDHLGIQAESGEELKEIYARLHGAPGNAENPSAPSSKKSSPIKALLGLDLRITGLRVVLDRAFFNCCWRWRLKHRQFYQIQRPT
jgi:hypothetical protein